MTILIGILTAVLVLNCFFLVLLILIQLPKKESGSGLAFGGGTLDMALGAGAGNVLTKLTKASASLFLLLCLVLAIIGGLFVLETASVIMQVVSFKLTGRRIFRMAPLHHHFEQKGWAEPTIVIRFWIIAIILALAGLATLKLR